jgi:hypothetical protein
MTNLLNEIEQKIAAIESRGSSHLSELRAVEPPAAMPVDFGQGASPTHPPSVEALRNLVGKQSAVVAAVRHFLQDIIQDKKLETNTLAHFVRDIAPKVVDAEDAERMFIR